MWLKILYTQSINIIMDKSEDRPQKRSQIETVLKCQELLLTLEMLSRKLTSFYTIFVELGFLATVPQSLLERQSKFCQLCSRAGVLFLHLNVILGQIDKLPPDYRHLSISAIDLNYISQKITNKDLINQYIAVASKKMQLKKKQSISNAVGVKQYAIYQEHNNKCRDQMEDTSFVQDCFMTNCPKSTLFGVFDGHGGKSVSTRLATLLPNVIKNNLKNGKANVGEVLTKSFVEIDEKLKEGLQEEAGSTGTVGLITIQQSKRMLYLAHVGDSLAYLFEDGGCQLLTKQHRGTNMEEKKRVQQNGGKILNNRLCGVLAVTRAFGDYSLKAVGCTAVPEIKKLQIRLSHKYIVVGSDGLWDFIDIKQAHKTVKQYGEAQDIAKILTKIAVENGSNDNITVLVLKLN